MKLTRKTVAEILSGIEGSVFTRFRQNPESFIAEASRLIQEQKATTMIERLSYNALTDTHAIDIFTDNQGKQDFSKAGKRLKRLTNPSSRLLIC